MLTIRSRAVSGSILRLALVTGTILALYILYLVSVRVSPAEAVFHLVQIDEVMAGAHGNPDIQFVEMRMCCGGQNNQGNSSKLVFFSSSGDQMGEFLFPSNPNDGTNVSFLIATQAFADLFTTPAPDFIMPPLLHAGSGKVCYKNLTGAGFEVNLCPSYGAFTGDTETDVRGDPAGPPAPSLPIAGTTSLKRMANFGNFEAGQFNADFALSTPEPTNSLGETGAVSLPQTGDLIVTKAADPDPVRVETNLTYTIEVLNNSLAAATGVTVTDTLPLDVNFESATAGCSGAGTVTCALGTMSSGGRATVTIVVTPTEAGILTNTATVTGDQADPNMSDNFATINTTVNPPALAEVEPNDPIASAQVVPIPASGAVEITGVLGTIGSGDVDDLDFYSFQGSIGDVVTIDIDNAIGGLQSFDSMVALFGPGPGFSFLLQSDDASIDPGSISNADSRIDDFQLLSTGIFTVVVTSCCRSFQDGGVVGPGPIRNGDYTLIISGVTPTPVTGGPPQLVSIAVTPEAASIPVGMTQQFTAIGSFSDGSTADVTAAATWESTTTQVFPTLVGAAGGPALAVAHGTVAGVPHVFYGSWPHLVAADVSDPVNPVEVGRLELPGLINGLFFRESDSLLFVANDEHGGLRIVDVSDPAVPVEAGFLDTPGQAVDVIVSGDLALVADNGGGLRIVDVSDPSTPVEVGSFQTGDAQAVGVSGDLAFFGGFEFGLSILDISDPGAPAEQGSFSTGGAQGLFVSGDSVFVADPRSVLRILDVSDPTAPVEVGSADTSGSAVDVVVSGDLAFVAERGSGLQVIDISAPSTPLEVGSLDTPGIALDISLSGTLAFIADGSGVLIAQVANPAVPAQVGFLQAPKDARNVAVSGDLALIATRSSGLSIMDISNPMSPVELGSLDNPGSASGLALSGDLAFLVDSSAGLVVVDVSDAAAPVMVGSADTPGSAFDVVVSGDIVFVADFGSGLRILDVSDPTAPVEIGSSDTPGLAFRVAVSREVAFVADGPLGLTTIDVSDPTAPVQIGTADTGNLTVDVVVSGDLAYVADLPTGLRILDVSDPSTPMLLGTLEMLLGRAFGIFVSGDLAYVAGRRSGPRIIDVSTPSAPVELGLFDNPGFAQSLVVSGDLAFLADGEGGLLVLDVGTTVVTIDSGGLATALRAGTAGITATLDGVTGDATLTVTPPQPVSIAVTPQSPSVSLGNSRQFTATASLTNGSTADATSSVAWASSNPLVATIGTGGLATAVGIGTADISATSGDISASTMLSVPGASLAGHVVLEGDSRPDPGFQVDVTLSFFTPGADTSIDQPLAVLQDTTSLVPIPRMAEFLIPDAPWAHSTLQSSPSRP